MIKCFVCDKPIPKYVWLRVITSDGQTVTVGFNCYKKIKATKDNGYQPPSGGPRLYLIKEVKP